MWKEILKNYRNLAYHVVLNKNVPTSILKILATHPSLRVRNKLALREDFTEELYRMLAKDPNSSVLELLLSNLEVPEEVIKELPLNQELINREIFRRKIVSASLKWYIEEVMDN